MDFTSPLFLGHLATAIAGLGATALVAVKVPFPDKWVIFLGLGLIGLHGLLNTLYQMGGVYTMVFPALFWIKAVLETTGALALVVASYSFLHKSQVSAHWYSLPTGCAPLSMAAQSVPSAYLLGVLFGLFFLYVAFLKYRGQLDKSRSAVVLPGAILVLSTIVREAVLLDDIIYNFALGAVALLFAKIIVAGQEGASKGGKIF